MANQFLIKNTMADLRALSATEITGLTNGTYSGVHLLGYYQAGDTPDPIDYYLSATTDSDDGGSVILVGGIKLVHYFASKIDARYYGAMANDPNDQSAVIQKAIDAGSKLAKKVYFSAGVYMINGRYNSGGNGIMLKSGSDIETDENTIFKVTPQTSGAYTAFSIVEADGVYINRLNLIGDKDEHKAPSGAIYKVRQSNTNYNVGDAVIIEQKGFEVVAAGITGTVVPDVKSIETIGQTFVDTDLDQNGDPIPGGVIFKLISVGVGEWGMGLSILSSKNVEIENLKVTKFWGDGIYIGKKSDLTTSENITINFADISDCRRQGISIVTVDGLFMDRIKIDAIAGAPPQSGIDFEPNTATEVIRKVKINVVECKNSADYAVAFVFHKLAGSSTPVDIEIGEIIAERNGALRISGVDYTEKRKGLARIGTIRSTNARNYAVEIYNIKNGVDVHIGDIYIQNANQANNIYPYGAGVRIYAASETTFDPSALPTHYKINNIYSSSSDGKMTKIIDVYEHNRGILDPSGIQLDITGEVQGEGIHPESTKYRIKSAGSIHYEGLRNKPNSGDNISLTSNTMTKLDNRDFTAEATFTLNNMPVGWEIRIEVVKDLRIGVRASFDFRLFNFQHLESRALTSAVAGSSILIKHIGNNIWDIKYINGRWYYGTEILQDIVSYATANTSGLVLLASEQEVINGINPNKVVTPATLQKKIASVSQLGFVRQTTVVTDVTLSNSTKTILDDATDLATAIALVNDIKAKYNQAVELNNELKVKLNAKLASDRASGQQAS